MWIMLLHIMSTSKDIGIISLISLNFKYFIMILIAITYYLVMEFAFVKSFFVNFPESILYTRGF